MVRPDAPQFDIAHAERWHNVGQRRLTLLFLTWLVALVVALIASDFSSVVYVAVVATPVLLLMRPVLGALTGLVAGALLVVAPEPMVVRVLFGLHALLSLFVLIRLWHQARAQRAVVASVGRAVSVDLPDDLRFSRDTRIRPFVVLGFVAIGVVAGIFAADVVWWVLVGCFALIHVPGEIAVRVLPFRVLTRPRHAVSMLVRAEPGGRVLLMTDNELCPVASIPVNEIMHQPGLDDPLLALTQGLADTPRTPPVPATVVGDFRIGGWIAVVTDNCVLLPDGPLRDNWVPPVITVPPSLVDGRKWSGLQSN